MIYTEALGQSRMAAMDQSRLDEESSSYLRSRASDSVNWQPWDERALEAARESHAPIFLSIGYSTCPWSQKMAAKTFTNERIANLLNEHFVPICVDRQERPDLDTYFQTVCQTAIGESGWPLSAWLTPEKRPYYVGTYLPPESDGEVPGFLDVLERIINNWPDTEVREAFQKRGDEWHDRAKRELEWSPKTRALRSATDPKLSLTQVADAAVKTSDEKHGGWGLETKFPHAERISCLLRASVQSENEDYERVGLDALDAMATGALYDQIGGGFYRYCTERGWTVPAGEKTLYDNAVLPKVFIQGYRVSGDNRYKRVATETVAFLERELSHAAGHFCSSLQTHDFASQFGDASERSSAMLGADYYKLTIESLASVIDDPELREFACDRYGITNSQKPNVPGLAMSKQELASEHGLSTEEVTSQIETIREKLITARESELEPNRDEMVVSAWNGLAIQTLAEMGMFLDTPYYTERAITALEAIQKHCWDDQQLLRFSNPETETTRSKHRDRRQGFLSDYSFVGRGALSCYEATGDRAYLSFAVDIGEQIADKFWNPNASVLRFCSECNDLDVTLQGTRDRVGPSSVAVAIELLAMLDAIVSDNSFERIIDTVIETQGSRIQFDVLQHASLAMTLDRIRTGPLEGSDHFDD